VGGETLPPHVVHASAIVGIAPALDDAPGAEPSGTIGGASISRPLSTTSSAPGLRRAQRLWPALGVLAILAVGGGVAIAVRPGRHDRPPETTDPSAAVVPVRPNTANTTGTMGTTGAAPPAAATHALTIVSTPPGAIVWENGRQLGRTPLRLEQPSGITTPRQFRLESEGYAALALSQQPADHDVQLQASLVPLPRAVPVEPTSAAPGAMDPTPAATDPPHGPQNGRTARSGARRTPSSARAPGESRPALDIRLER
jgi:hypothetical protein